MSVIIRINRIREFSQSTIGELKVYHNDIPVFMCYTLENLKEGTARNQDLRIPAGDYKLYWRESPSKGLRVHLYNDLVPADRYIMIHAGNYEKDTLGCILLGSTYQENFVGFSRKAVQDFEQVIRHYAPDLNNAILEVRNHRLGGVR